MSIREGFNEMWKTLKTGKGYEQRLAEDRRAYEKQKDKSRRKLEESREKKRKERERELMEIKRKNLQSKIKQDLARKEREDKRKQKKEEKKLTKTISPVKKTDDMSFSEAFKSSKSAGKKEFTWRGNKYHTRTKEEEVKKYEDGGTSDVQRHQSPGFQTMFEVGSKMNLFGGGPASERAKMRHERKMNRQGAKADRKMVRTEGRQERKGDRLEGRQETRSRRQDRRDARQDSRLGYYEKGGKTPRIKKKDRPKGAELDELMYKQQYGENYADDPNMDRELPTGVLSEIQSTPEKYNKGTKTKAGQFISKLVGAKEHDPNKKRKYKEDRTQSIRKKTRKKKNILGKTIIYGDTLDRQDSRSTADQVGNAIRTKSYDIVDSDGNKKRVYFKTQEEADRYFKNIDKDTGKIKDVKLIEGKETGKQGLYEVDNKDGTKTVQYIPEKTKDIVEGTDITDQDRKTDEQLQKEIDADIRDRERHVMRNLTPERKKEIEKQHQQKNTNKEGELEQDIRGLAEDSPGSGITSEHSALDFSDQSTTNLKNPSKYSDNKTKYVYNPAKGTVTEKVKRRSGIGYKKTGREKDIEGYQELADEKRQQRESEESKKPSRKEKNQQKKDNKKQAKEEKAKQAEVARKAREEGKSSYTYNGTTYNITPKVMKGGGTLMNQYNRKYNTGGVNMDEDQDGLPIGIDATPSGTMQGPTMPPNFNNNNNQMSIDGNNLGNTATNTATNTTNGGAQEDETQINNNLNQQDNSMDQQDDSLDQGGMDQGQDPAGPTRAQLRHERKSARQQARADRRMVRTEARQQRKADRLAGRMEKRGRRQDRKDLRQEARISKREDRRARRRGNFKDGGMVKGNKGAGLGIIIMVGRKSNKRGK